MLNIRYIMLNNFCYEMLFYVYLNGFQDQSESGSVMW